MLRGAGGSRRAVSAAGPGCHELRPSCRLGAGLVNRGALRLWLELPPALLLALLRSGDGRFEAGRGTAGVGRHCQGSCAGAGVVRRLGGAVAAGAGRPPRRRVLLLGLRLALGALILLPWLLRLLHLALRQVCNAASGAAAACCILLLHLGMGNCRRSHPQHKVALLQQRPGRRAQPRRQRPCQVQQVAGVGAVELLHRLEAQQQGANGCWLAARGCCAAGRGGGSWRRLLDGQAED